jgi:hypothetical protein
MQATHNRSIDLFALTVASLYILVAGDTPSSATQYTIIKCLCNEGEMISIIAFSYPLGKNAFHVLLCSNGAGQFKDGCEHEFNMPHAWRPATAVNQGPVCVDFLLERTRSSGKN